MTKKQFLSVFKAYIIRSFGISQATATRYEGYLEKFGTDAHGTDHLKRIADSGVRHNQMRYAQEIRHHIADTAAPGVASSYQTAVNYLERFITRPAEGTAWPRFAPDRGKLRETVIYDDPITPPEQVDGLSIALKNEYIRVVRLARLVFGDQFAQEDYAYIPVILAKKEPEPVRYEVREAFLKKLQEKAERQDLTEEEWRVLKTGVIWVLPVARFFLDPAGKPRIEIYYANTCAGSFAGYLAKLKNWLAHEYMHYLHYRYCQRIRDGATWKDDGLREGMADFFAMAFTLYRDGEADWDVAMEQYIHWCRWFDSGLPYANALCFYTVNGKEFCYAEAFEQLVEQKSIQKLSGVLQKCDSAHNAMLN